MGRKTFEQLFQAYVEPPLPMFLTSDTVLNAYHLLFEQCLLRLETRHARPLPGILEGMAGRLGGEGPAQGILSVALGLLGRTEEWGEDVERIRRSVGQFKPPWLGPPDTGFLALDYARYRPRGFYTRSSEL